MYVYVYVCFQKNPQCSFDGYIALDFTNLHLYGTFPFFVFYFKTYFYIISTKLR